MGEHNEQQQQQQQQQQLRISNQKIAWKKMCRSQKAQKFSLPTFTIMCSTMWNESEKWKKSEKKWKKSGNKKWKKKSEKKSEIKSANSGKSLNNQTHWLVQLCECTKP